MEAKTRAAWDEHDRMHRLERWRSITMHHEIVADGHRLTTLGGHTGHMTQTVALCENAEIATALAEALSRGRRER